MRRATPHSPQAPAAGVMVRPHHFQPNPDTVFDNGFQAPLASLDPGNATEAAALARRARAEVTTMAQRLEDAGVTVHLFEDEGMATPDAVFPNNWFSTHAGGHVAVYPMAAPSRQRERRWDIIEMLKARYRVQDVIDYSGLAADGIYLEGTGAMVLDHVQRVAYAVRSRRTDPVALERFCTHFNFEPMAFDAADAHGQPIYHTNVLMCVGTGFAMVCLDMIADARRRTEIGERLSQGGRALVALSPAQIADFAGNALELQGRDGRLLALSRRAMQALTSAQRATLADHATLLPLDVPTIELAGGSVRCMLAGVHLAPRPQRHPGPHPAPPASQRRKVACT